MKSIKLKSICPEVLITLNNLRDCEIDEADGSVSVTFRGPSSPTDDASKTDGDRDRPEDGPAR